MKKRKTYEVSVINKTYSKTYSDETKFYTSDTALELNFQLKEVEYDFDSAEIILLNVDDRSLVTRPVVKSAEGFTYELEDDIVEHYGEWKGQLKFNEGGEIYVSSPVIFRIENDLNNDRPPKLNEVNTWKNLREIADKLIIDLQIEQDETLGFLENRQDAVESKFDLLQQALALPQIELPNLVKNGNFSNGTEGWHTSPAFPIRTDQNRLMIDMTTETIRSNLGVYQVTPELKIGRKYYFSVRMTLPKTTNILQFIKNVSTPYISVTGNESVFISNIIEVDNTSDTLNRVQLSINTSEFSVGDTIIIQDVNVFDITDYESLNKIAIDEVASEGHLPTYYMNEGANVPQLVGTVGDGVIKPRPISEYPISVSNDSVSIEKFTPDLRSVLTLPQIAMTNVTLNGDFSEGATSWYLNNNGAKHEIIDNEAIVTVTEDSIRGNLPIYQVNNNLKTNTKYYMSVEILPDVSTTAVLSIKVKSTGYIDISSSDWNFVSEIIEVDTAESSLNRIYVYFNALNFSPGQKIRIKNITVIELDDDENNNLSKEYLDLTVKSNDYIKNTQLVTINNGNKNIIGSTGIGLKPMPSTVFTSHLHGKTSVHMGDSITGNAFEHDYPSYVGERTGLNVHNVGFGGTRAGKHAENYDRFSFYRLANCIAQNDYSSLHLPFPEQPWTYPARIEILENIDWNEVDILTLAYGANDWRANSPVDLENLRDENSFKGALRSGIETILQAYPHLQIIIVSPFYRFNTSEGWDSDDEIINYGNTGIMKDYWVASKEIATEFKFPHFDAYYSLGINSLNKSQYFAEPDGTHHIKKGRELIGHKLASFMLSNL